MLDQIIKTKRNKVLMDAYNANPNSMRETINYFDYIQSPDQKLRIFDWPLCHIDNI